jgi:hypothetical protein
MSHNISHGKSSVNRQVFLLGAVLNFGYLASCIHVSSRVYLFQQAQCLTYYKTYDPTMIDSHHGVAEALCKLDKIQSPLSVIEGIDSFLQFLPGISSTLLRRLHYPYHRRPLRGLSLPISLPRAHVLTSASLNDFSTSRSCYLQGAPTTCRPTASDGVEHDMLWTRRAQLYSLL